MLNYKQLMGEYIWEMYATNSLTERFKIYEKYITHIGFSSAIYTFVPLIKIGDATLEPLALTTNDFSLSFLQHYMDHNLVRDDFTIRLMNQGHMQTMDWREHELSNTLLNKETQVIETAREEFNIKNAVSIPLMLQGLGGAGVSITSDDSDAQFQSIKEERMQALQYFTQVFHDLNLLNLQKIPLERIKFLNSLSEKEIGILKYLASGKKFSRIAYHIDVASYKVASNMLDNLRKKFEDEFNERITRDQLMYLIGLLDILSLYPDQNKPYFSQGSI